MIGPGARRDHHAVHDRRAVHELRARRADVRLQRRVGGGAPPLEHPGGGQRERSVAQLRNRLLGLEEVPDDPLHVRVVADVLGCPAAGNHERDVVARIHVREGEVGVPGVAGLLRVGVVAVDEVMDDELELLPRGRGDLDVVAGLEQALVGVHDLERFRGVAGEHQDLGHGSPPSG